MKRNIQKAKKSRLQKILGLAMGAIFLSGQAAPVAMAAQQEGRSGGLMEPASQQDLQKLKDCMRDGGSRSFVPQNLLMKGFQLTNYEMLVISELIKNDIQKKSENSDEKYAALKDLVDLQKKYAEEYEMIFSRLPQDIVREANTLEEPSSHDISTFGMDNDPWAEKARKEAEERKNAQPVSFAPSESDILKMAEQYGIKLADPRKAADSVSGFQAGLDGVGGGRELSDALSLINIRRSPSDGREGEYKYSNPLNPVQELNTESSELGEPNLEAGIQSEDDKYHIRSLQEIIDEAAHIEDEKAKHFFLTLAHSISYIDSGTKGTQKLNTSIRDDNGNLYEVAVPEEHELVETLEIGLGIRVHKALDLIVSMVAENEDGNLSQDGTSWDFGNVLFKFHPERLDRAVLKKYDSEGNLIRVGGQSVRDQIGSQLGGLVSKGVGNGIEDLEEKGYIIEDGGRVVGKRLGNETSVVTDTQSGTTSLRAGSARMVYDRDEGFQFTNEDSRYYIGFGKMSLDLSTYTLQLSDCKAVQVGYHDNAQELRLIYGRPNDTSEGYTDEDGTHQGTYRKDVIAAQYIAKNFIPDMKLTFNFAKSMDKGNLSNPNGAAKATNTVYSLMVQGATKKTSYEGEFAHMKRSIKGEDGSVFSDSANADFLDISHRFSEQLRGNLHLINIDGNYDASAMVEDKTGENLLTTTKGDGTPDYLYQPGQRGLDLTLNYTIDETASLAFGYTRYSETEDGNSKTEAYISGSKQWSLGDLGNVSLQQRFGYNDVSNRDFVNRSSDTTVAYSGKPWKDGSVSADYQKTIDKESGNETRYDLTVSHDFKPVERVTITPKFQFERKVGDEGEGISVNSGPMDTTTIINSVTVGYEIIPEELTVNLLVSKEKYDVIASEIDESTGKKIDGERRNTLGVGLGLVWEPKKIAGLTIGVSYRRDKVDYLDRQDNSNQDVWEYSVEYSRPISDKIRASISYDYKSAKDKIKPIYDDVTRNIAIDIDARIGKHTSIQLQHEYESEYKPLDGAANSTTHTTTLQMVNRF